MRLIASIGDNSQEIIGEAFNIDGSGERFAVHPAVGLDGGEFAATHLGTGLRLALAATPDEAITEARQRWLAKTPAEIAERIAKSETYPSCIRVTAKEVAQ